jgi:hypothetical protein
MVSLYRLVAAHHERLEADLQHHYRIDLRDLWRGGLSLRRLGVLVKGLPPESLTVSALADQVDPDRLAEPEFERRWSVDQHLLAGVMDAVNALHHSYSQAHSKRRIGKFTPLVRPGKAPPRRRLSAAAREKIRRRNHGD